MVDGADEDEWRSIFQCEGRKTKKMQYFEVTLPDDDGSYRRYWRIHISTSYARSIRINQLTFDVDYVDERDAEEMKYVENDGKSLFIGMPFV